VDKKVILVTGGSSGMGKETAKVLAGMGHKVYAAARRVENMEDLKALGVTPLALDITKEEQCRAVVDQIQKDEGRIDVLVNNAGYGLYGTVEETSIDEARYQFEVNIFGLAAITQMVIPGMRDRKSGRIVNISSMGGKMYTLFGAWYHATKHALEGWSDCLRVELKQFGIDVVVVEPGGIQTAWGGIAMENLEKISAKGPYSEYARKVVKATEELHKKKNLTPVEVLGKEIAKASTVKKPKTRYLKGFMAVPLVFLRRLLSDRAYDNLLLSQYK
jgi:short-subunit dehydrogenase